MSDQALCEVLDVDVFYFVLVGFTTREAAEWAAGEIGTSFDCHVVEVDAVYPRAPVIASVSSPGGPVPEREGDGR